MTGTPEARLASYLNQFEPMQRGKVRQALTRAQGVNGVYKPRYLHAEAFAADDGFRVDAAKGRVYTGRGTFFDLPKITQTLVDYALHLRA